MNFRDKTEGNAKQRLFLNLCLNRSKLALNSIEILIGKNRENVQKCKLKFESAITFERMTEFKNFLKIRNQHIRKY